ncbi:MAG: pyrroline-5-carboxylate reductase [Candidatus Omnitrophica bacterium]|nr:pyrroline-5-carboxylate reductase [Candidatus Omnitrophota bacterium]
MESAMFNKKIGIIGCGNMGEAIFSRLARVMEKSTSLMVSEIDAVRRDVIQSKYKIIVEIDNNYLVKFSDVIIIAVKPQDFDKVLNQEVCCGVSKDKLVISIAAGITIKHIEGVLGVDVPVIRVMPNMPAMIGEAISALSAGTTATKEHMDIAKLIFSTIGEVIEVDEKLIDAVTAISGSGPAYFFYLAEALHQAAVKLGLDEEVAKRLVFRTAVGTAKLWEYLKDEPARIRQKVTSKGGTTEAAINVFEAKHLKKIISQGVAAAARRSKELSRR